MSSIVFDLSSVESKQKFCEVAEIVLETHDTISEKLLIKLEEKASAIELHRLHFHEILMQLLHERGGMGMTLATREDGWQAVLCQSCNTVSVEINWLCPTCNVPYLGLSPLITCVVTGMEFVFIRGGVFKMGNVFAEEDAAARAADKTDNAESDEDSDDDDEYGYDYELPVHEVELDDFYIGKYLVTQAEWEKVMGNNPSYFDGDAKPVEYVSWNDIQEFLEKLNSQTGLLYRLPTEAEWEYAARSGGRKERWSGTSDEKKLRGYAWHDDNSDCETHPVGEKKPNLLGLYDMTGNVWEWCSDWYDAKYYESSPGKNPQGADSGTYRVLRGGSWLNRSECVRVASRRGLSPVRRKMYYGFRLAFSAHRN